MGPRVVEEAWEPIVQGLPSAGGTYVKLNATPIASAGAGARYSYVDDSVWPGKTYHYKLDQVDVFLHNFFDEKLPGCTVSSVKVNGSDECLKDIPE